MFNTAHISNARIYIFYDMRLNKFHEPMYMYFTLIFSRTVVNSLWTRNYSLLTEHYNEGHFNRLNFGSGNESSRRRSSSVPSRSLA